MTDFTKCESCGHPNPTDRDLCERCNFPRGPVAASTPGTALQGGEIPEPPPAPASEPDPPPMSPTTRPFRLRRPPREPGSQTAATLWLVFGAFAAAVVLFTAIQANVQRAAAPKVEGSTENQQKKADAFREVLAQDSTNVDARVGLADVLYDTGNWSEAIVHYSSAIARDSTRVAAIVDLGVCYYNLGVAPRAEQLFQVALERDPHHPVALFNLGIVYEAREKYDTALAYFHRALQSGPPENMQEPLMQAMQRTLQKSGKTAPPLPGG